MPEEISVAQEEEKKPGNDTEKEIEEDKNIEI